jgi:hypothetical protein
MVKNDLEGHENKERMKKEHGNWYKGKRRGLKNVMIPLLIYGGVVAAWLLLKIIGAVLGDPLIKMVSDIIYTGKWFVLILVLVAILKERRAIRR